MVFKLTLMVKLKKRRLLNILLGLNSNYLNDLTTNEQISFIYH
jgi:hypothetical protein